MSDLRTGGEKISLVCQDCGAGYEVGSRTPEYAAKGDFTFQRMMLYCQPCRHRRIAAMLSGPALKQVVEALASASENNPA